MAATRITGQQVSDGGITDADIATANKDGGAATPSMRTLGTGAAQAAAGNDSRFLATPVSVANGGTGQSSYTNGELLVGQTTGNTLAKKTVTGAVSMDKDGVTTLNPASVPASVLDGVVANFSIEASASSGTLTITVKSQSGGTPSATDPVSGLYRSATDASGSTTRRQVTAALTGSLLSGATLGAVASQPLRVWLVLIDDAGTIRVGTINYQSHTTPYDFGATPLREDFVWSATQMTTSSDSHGVLYADAAASTKSIRIIGYLEWASGLATPGTWTAPSKIHCFTPGTPLPGAGIPAGKTEVESLFSQEVYVRPSHMQYHPGVAKAWVNFDGTGTVTITNSYNVTSITDEGTGKWTVNVTTGFSGSNYCAVATAVTSEAGDVVTDNRSCVTTREMTSGSWKIRSANLSTSSIVLADADVVCSAAFGDQ